MKKYFKNKMKGKSPMVIVGIVLFGIVAIGAMAILFGYILMSLWNWLMPELFDLPMITYWQAVGLFFLAKILFGFGGGNGGGGSKKSRKDGSRSCGPHNHKKRDFSKWAHYDKFWEEKGEEAYNQFVENIDNNGQDDGSKQQKNEI